MEVIKTFKTTDWSGGKTTEMFIYPEACIYSDRNFDFRISSATIEVESSNFTPLEGYYRLLTIIDGEIELIVNNSTQVTLKQDEPFWFSGSDDVTSRGKVRDFNVIFSADYRVNWQVLDAGKITESAFDFRFLYIVKGELLLNGNKIIEGELVKFDSSSWNSEFEINFDLNSRIYKIDIELKR